MLETRLQESAQSLDVPAAVVEPRRPRGEQPAIRHRVRAGGRRRRGRARRVSRIDLV